MKPSYQNEGFHQYMYLDVEGIGTEHYVISMLTQYQGKVLLPFQLCGQNGMLKLCYDITGTVSLAQMIKGRELDSSFLKHIFQVFLTCCEEVEEYLLPTEGILLNPDFIYYLPGKERIRLCYMPRQEDGVSGEFLRLIEFLMRHTDHTDAAAVMYIYGLYRYAQGEVLNLQDIREYIKEQVIEPKKGLPAGNSEHEGESQAGVFLAKGRHQQTTTESRSGYKNSGLEGVSRHIKEASEKGNVRKHGSREDLDGEKFASDGDTDTDQRDERNNKSKRSNRNCFIYGAGSIIFAGLTITSAIRFWIVTKQEQDLKYMIILGFATLAFGYCYFKSRSVSKGRMEEAYAHEIQEAGVSEDLYYAQREDVQQGIVQNESNPSGSSRIGGMGYGIVQNEGNLTGRSRIGGMGHGIVQNGNNPSGRSRIEGIRQNEGTQPGISRIGGMRQGLAQNKEKYTENTKIGKEYRDKGKKQTDVGETGRFQEQKGETLVLAAGGIQRSIISPVKENEPYVKLVSLEKAVPDILLYYFPCVLGRKEDSVDYVISVDGVSRRHAMVFFSGDNLYVEDLDSTNGTYVDQDRLSPGAPLQLLYGAVLRLGPVRYKVERGDCLQK